MISCKLFSAQLSQVLRVQVTRKFKLTSRISVIANFSTSQHAYTEGLNERQKELMMKGLPKKKSIPGVNHIVLVCSGKGGVGKSTTAVNLAVSMANCEEKLSIGLLDADVFGPTVPLMMNLNEEPLLTKDNKMVPPVNYNVKCMSMGLLISESSAVVWRGLMVMSALEKLLRQVDWGSLDCLIIDTPPGTGDTLLSLMQNLPISGVIIVTSPQKAANMVAKRGATMLKKLDVPVIGIVLNMSSAVCPQCDHIFPIFNDDSEHISQELEAPILCDIPLDPKIASYGDLGTPITLVDPKGHQAEMYKILSKSVIEFLKNNKTANSEK